MSTSQVRFTMKEEIGIGDSQDNKVIDKLKLCCEICSNHNISIKCEDSNSKSNNTEDLHLKDDSDDIKTEYIKPSGDPPQNETDAFQIKPEVNGDSDIEVDLAYRIIDTFNICKVKTFKQELHLPEEDEKISPDAKSSMNRGLQNNHKQTHEDDVSKLHSKGM